jgi:hypothetical protein
LPGLLFLTANSPVVCKSNQPALQLGVGNGTFARVRRFILHPADAAELPTREMWDNIGDVDVVFCSRPPVAVVVVLEKPSTVYMPQFSGLAAGEIPILPVSWRISPKTKLLRAGAITRTQVPIVGGYAITDFAAQVSASVHTGQACMHASYCMMMTQTVI